MGILEGGAVALVFFFLGRLNRKRTGLRDPRPVCGCKHHRSFHAKGTGECRYVTRIDSNSCRCQQYTGPEPLPELYS